MDELVNDPELKKKTGAIGVLSKGLLTRTELNEIVVLMAMILRLNPELWNVPSPTAPRSPLAGV